MNVMMRWEGKNQQVIPVHAYGLYDDLVVDNPQKTKYLDVVVDEHGQHNDMGHG